MVEGLEFRVQDLSFRGVGSGFGVQGIGLRFNGLGLWVLFFRVLGSGFWV